MNEFQNEYSPFTVPNYFYLRVYRENGKLRLQALKEAHPNLKCPEDYILRFYHGSNYKAHIYLYFDGLEPNMKLMERIVPKVYEFFSGAWFFKGV